MAQSSTITKYGLPWDAWLTPLQIEFVMIQQGGQIVHNGLTFGNGLFYHYREAQSLCWPTDDHHRWSDLMLKTILEQRLTVVMGARDSSKTYTFSKFSLIDYWAFPTTTLILMSSTDLRGLELRVWGNVKDLFQRARDLHDWLPGNVVDGKHGIFTDELMENGDVRDIRKGILCFPAGTMIDTPNGSKRIEDVQTGDEVINAIGTGTVYHTFENHSSELAEVALCDGRKIVCTPDHRFFTRRGWIKASCLNTSDEVFSAHETLQMLSQSDWGRLSKQEVLFAGMPRERTSGVLRILRNGIQAVETPRREVLQRSLRWEMGGIHSASQAACDSEMRSLRRGIHGPFANEVLLGEVPEPTRRSQMPGMRSNLRVDTAFDYPQSNEVLFRILQMEMDEQEHWRESLGVDTGGNRTEAPVSRRNIPPSGLHGETFRKEHPAFLRTRHGLSKHQTGRGNRRGRSQYRIEEGKRSREDFGIAGTRVESITLLKKAGCERFERDSEGYKVYNIAVTGHPSYSVNGVLVHNCIPCLGSQGEWSGGLEKFLGIKQKRRRLIGDELQFMPLTYLNCLSNLDKGDFKAGFCGNPLGPGNPLDKVAEPVAGWDSLGEVTKTSTWKNRFDGVTIDLVGWDSPNFDSPEGKPAPYPYLIDRNDVKRVVDRYGKDSMQFWSQIAGVRKAGINAHCVLTRELCIQHEAFKPCIWSGEDTTKVYGIDAGYGGDLCIGIMIEFGKDVTGQQVVKFFPPTIIPVQMSIPESPEDQIANFAKAECKRLDIPDENVFVEAGMRATLIVSMSRIMSSRINAVNFGGAATDRPVSNDLFIYDEKTRSRRLKRCNEHYSKFVTELWMSLRALIESNQCRELPDAVADEAYLREWRFVSGDRYELETKAECKERTGFSPNNADAAVTALEGARRLGFVIERIPVAGEQGEGRDDWLYLEVEKQKRLLKSNELNYV